jgi:CRISPR-associated endonuclease/helicase Cas3
MNELEQFRGAFQKLTGYGPFPWQEALYIEHFSKGEFPPSCNLPTGLGKTAVVAIWLTALAYHPERIPRRLVYVVNRRTVVDQTTNEVEKLRSNLRAAGLFDRLARLCAIPLQESDAPLASSTLRGQFADNRAWCADPTRPAVIVGTVDMVGSGLLFSRYTCGFKTRPHHAALLGQDAMLIHDEAHLEPAFQKLLGDIIAEQARCRDSRPLRVLELTATTRGTDSSFALSRKDEEDPRVKSRLRARKCLTLHPINDEKRLAEELTTLALARDESGRAILVFARSVEVVRGVAESLGKKNLPTVVLTGTMRGKERDDLAQKNPEFLRFLPPSSRPENAPPLAKGTVYLVATSAGEVGVNISADDLICDLSTYESMAQRFGRVNRFGDTPDTTIELIYPNSFKTDDPLDTARARTLELLRRLEGNASSDALRKLDAAARAAAFSPLPEMLPAADAPVPDILFDAWALTTIRDALAGRPPVAPYLHGEPPHWELPETYVAWRREVDVIKGPLLDYYTPEELLDDYPLKPHELLRDHSYRVREQFGEIWERIAQEPGTDPETSVWIINEDGSVVPERLSVLADKESERRLYGRTILLPPSVGGLSEAGLLEGKCERSEKIKCDVADLDGVRQRFFCSTSKIPDEFPKFRLSRAIDTWRAKEEGDDGEASDENRYWLWMEIPTPADKGGIRKAGKSVSLQAHTRDVEAHAIEIVRKLALPEWLARCVILAAHFHDFGKHRRYWQRGIGNDDEKIWLAKAGRELRSRTLDEPYRHEFGSLRDIERETEFQKLEPDERDLVLHLIAAHHGRARPHFPNDEAFDPEGTPADSEAVATEVPRRFARLQRRFGRWGLAYLESLLRAADYAASAGISPKQTTP